MSGAPRLAAARCVAAVLAGQSLQEALPQQRERTDPAQRPFFQQLVYGGLRALPRSEAVLALLLSKPLKDKDRDVQAVLLLGLYELDAMQTPQHAAVNAWVEAAVALRKVWAKGLINAALRRYLREREALLAKLSPAAAAAWPQWLWDEISRQWPQQRDEIVAASNKAPPMCLRLRAGNTARNDYLLSLSSAGIGASPCTLSPVGIRLQQGVDVATLPGFTDGAVSVQDEAAQLAAPLLQPLAGCRILDACAAPGGKTGHLAELAGADAEIVAMDVETRRLERVAENRDRLGFKAQLLQGDAAQPPAGLGQFTRILADVPCSASGVLRRNPDVKVLRRPSDIAQFATQQRAILQGLWPLLEQGGLLLYVTCSILGAENDEVVADFLAATPTAQWLPISTDWAAAAQQTRYGLQVLPTAGGPDGLYFSLLKRCAQESLV